MTGEEESFKYKLDISDAKAKAEELKQLLEEIKAKKAAGQDTSELEAQYAKEIDGLSKVSEKEKQAAGTTEELVKQKDRLGAVTRVLGARFSGLIGDLGGVIELLIQGGKSALMFGAALAGITGAVAVVRKLKEELKAAAQAQEELNQKVLEHKAAAIQQGRGLADQLLAFGAAERFDQAAGMATALTKQYGLAPAAAERAAALGTIAGLSPKQAGMLSVAIAQGVPIATPQQAAAWARDLPAEAAGFYRQQLEAYARAPAPALVRRVAQMPGAQGIGARFTTPEMLYEALRQQGALPEGVTSMADFRRHFEEAEKLVGQSMFEYIKEALRTGKPVGFTGGIGGHLAKPPGELAEAQRLLTLLEQSPSGRAPADISWAAQARGGAPATVIQYNVRFEERIGTKIGNSGDKRRRVWMHPSDVVGAPYPGKYRDPLAW
jgi:hypothetical protein